MKRALISFTVAVVCFVASAFITWLVWEMHMEGRAFRCVDAGLFTISIGPWSHAETHCSAGDQLQPGWTWQKVALVNMLYKVGFIALWIGSSVIALRIIRASDGSFGRHRDDPGPTTRQRDTGAP
jgi:hypothetical protein